MKQFGKIALALGVVAGAGLAAANSIEAATNTEMRSRIWQETNAQGQLVLGGANFTVADKQEAEEMFECNAEAIPCAVEVDAVDGNVIGEYIYHPE